MADDGSASETYDRIQNIQKGQACFPLRIAVFLISGLNENLVNINRGFMLSLSFSGLGLSY